MHLTEVNYALLALAVACCAFLTSGAPHTRADDFNLVLLHNNDIHGRFEETEQNTGTCQERNRNSTCIGGMARTAHVVRAFRQRAQEGTGPPVLYLNAGDTFVGTAWFSVFTWNISSAFMNLLKPDVITLVGATIKGSPVYLNNRYVELHNIKTSAWVYVASSLGNHEFDLTASVLSQFVDRLNFPVVAANMNFSQEPSLDGKFNKSVVFDLSGMKVGVIGYLTPETVITSSVGKVTFEDEVPAIRREAELLESQGVNVIIALGHSGYNMDQTIAREVELVDVVVGGHTNTFLWNGAQPDTEVVEDPYPKVITQSSGKQVPVVQAYAYTKYIGVLNCTFDANGDLTYFAGEPILMEASIPQEADVVQLLEVYRPAIDALNEEIIGYSRVLLDGDNWKCRHEECNLGNLITDALVSYGTTESAEKWSSVPIGIYNGGGIRNSITPQADTGAVTRADLIAVLPYGNQVIQLTLNGSNLLEAMEQMVRSNGETSFGEFPQVSGLRLVLDKTKEPFSRVVSLRVRCGTCDIPVYETVDPVRNYTLITSSFLADGGDGITVFSQRALSRKVMDQSDLDVVANYITKYSPVYPEVQGRIRLVNGTTDSEGNFGNKLTISWSMRIVLLIMLIRSTLK